jgi:hypothetical protein
LPPTTAARAAWRLRYPRRLDVLEAGFRDEPGRTLADTMREAGFTVRRPAHLAPTTEGAALKRA